MGIITAMWAVFVDWARVRLPRLQRGFLNHHKESQTDLYILIYIEELILDTITPIYLKITFNDI